MRQTQNIFLLEAEKGIRILFIFALVLTVIHVGIWSFFEFPPYETPFIVELFDLDSEKNIPTLFSVLILVLNGILLIWIWDVMKDTITHWKRHIWLLTAACFFFLSLDEFASIHERLIDKLRILLDLDGFLYFAWVIPYGIALLLFVILCVPTLWRTSGVARIPYFIAASVYVIGALGFEMIGAKYFSILEVPDSTFKLLTTFEELLEMVGLILFIRASLKLLLSTHNRLEIHLAKNARDASVKTLNET